MAMSEEREQKRANQIMRANQVMAILLPLLEAAGIGYGTYVIVYLICVQYLISPSENLRLEPRRATGIALIVVYFVLLLVFALTFLRMLQVIWVNPGVIFTHADASKPQPQVEKEGASTRYFDRLDAYICDYQGSPLWCEKCRHFKPDRTHHSSQLGRCIRRMDHFCPYAGGIISETSHKFFVQFLFYGFVWTGYATIVLAVFLAERSKEMDSRPTTWIVALALAALFFLFTFGMFMTTFHNMAVNLTTIEVIQKGGIYNIAMLGKLPAPPESAPFMTTASRTPTSESQSQSPSNGILCEIQRGESRSYIVLQTEPGDNPWDQGGWHNVNDIMGQTWAEWFLPWKMSPCISHRTHKGEFEWGFVVKRMMEQHGAGTAYARSSRSRSRRRSRRSRSATVSKP